jgi:Glycosyl hydrolase family 26
LSKTYPRTRILIAAAVAAVVAGALVIVNLTGGHGPMPAGLAASPAPAAHHKPGAYVGVYVPGSPGSYAGITAFTARTGIRPRVVLYYSGWPERFQARFAATAVRHGAVPLVQINPTGIGLAGIAAGRWDGYLRSYAAAVKRFGHPVILSFGHEMNGYWYSWGHRHTPASDFVAAWQHVVDVFRAAGARNVIWLWTVNVIDASGGIPSPAAWWPGSSYVNWVGIDGYYQKPSWRFAPLFGPTIKAVRKLTLAPILISETAARRSIGQPAKIADLFAGVRAYGLLGLVWFDNNHKGDWRLGGPAAFAAFSRGARMLGNPAP